MATIASITAAGRGAAHAWRVHAWQPANGGPCATLYHYSTAMLTWRVDSPDDATVLAYSTGWGSVSDQNGMNTAFKVLGLLYRFDRDGRGRATHHGAAQARLAGMRPIRPWRRARARGTSS